MARSNPTEDDKSRRGSHDDQTKSISGPSARLPAVKGTLGGIESPRHRHRHTPSMSTVAGDEHLPHPSGSSTPIPSNSKASPLYPEISQMSQWAGSSLYAASTTRSSRQATMFRSDPTLKTTFDTVPLEKKDEIKRLFLA
ncbi:hypothetical protein BD324DRAFT_650363 [Kockovaella imperatae]|uniref:Uncharacterized protein n=1 Tax=Kockovaella imperatae TaxID=4999 RepID=A0A1Y1UIE8_9TREE|nr:hypothetical protein BD324DRAFT_650363 [Kockovaella imperatae]ORX37818.1 hypothetical protein BD324DRAFT_650363 [Kockovaella imperatae]